MARRLALALGLPAFASLVLIAAPLANAKDIVCTAGQVSIPDDREDGGNLCVSQAEWDKAKEICAKHAANNDEIDPSFCICQDGDQAGACGD